MIKAESSSKRARWVGMGIIVLAFVITRLPFYLYMPLPELSPDTNKAYNILSIIEQRLDHVVGYPHIGYPLFLKACELVHNTSWFVTLAQGLLQLMAVLFFFHVYAKAFRRFLIPVSLVLVGYLTSAMTLHFDTGLFPDSLLGSTYIMGIALLIHALLNRSRWAVPTYVAIMIFSISVRPSGLVLIPPLLLLWAHQLWFGRQWRAVLLNLALTAVGLLLLATVNLMAPSHQSFSIITKPHISGQVRENMVTRSLDDPMLQELSEIVPHPDITLAARFPSITDRDSVFNLYLTTVLRPVTLGYGRIDRDTVLYLVNSNSVSIDLDSLSAHLGADPLRYADFRERFVAAHRDDRVMFRSERGWKYIQVHIPRFFWYFHTDRIADYPINFRDFYGELLRDRWNKFYVSDVWQTFSRRDHRLVGIEGVMARIAKELAFDTPITPEQAEADHQRLLDSPLYHHVLRPYYAVHPCLFRNAAYPFIFLLLTLICVVGYLRSGLRSPLFLIGIMGAGILLGTMFIHVVYRTSIYWRYTYQISFFYYFAVVMIPPIISALLNPAASDHDAT
jgi:hypothetical protein